MAHSVEGPVKSNFLTNSNLYFKQLQISNQGTSWVLLAKSHYIIKKSHATVPLNNAAPNDRRVMQGMVNQWQPRHRSVRKPYFPLPPSEKYISPPSRYSLHTYSFCLYFLPPFAFNLHFYPQLSLFLFFSFSSFLFYIFPLFFSPFCYFSQNISGGQYFWKRGTGEFIPLSFLGRIFHYIHP